MSASIVMQLVSRVLDSGCTPEDACRDSPDLLAQVREQLRRIRSLDVQVESLFPGTESALPDEARLSHPLEDLPRVPGHEVLSVLGHGGMGVVYKARHLRLNRTVAVKMLLGGAHADPASLKRLLREAEAVAALRHPNIVQVHEVGEHEGLPYFTMELVEGASLREKLEGRVLDAREAASLVSTLAEAMEVAHASGIVHRDLKPANVLLTPDGVPKIADFGIARRIGGESSLTLTDARLGTPSFMAPEQALGGSRAIGPAADVYALGGILYAAVTGRPPFQSDACAVTLLQVIKDEPVRPSRLNPRVPRDLETICLKCLSKDPMRRYVTAAALAADLQRFLRGEPILARPVGFLERTAKWVRRRPAQATIAAGSVLAVLALAGAAVWLGLERRAIERAAREDLLEADREAAAANWPGARTAIERARARLSDGGSADLLAEVEQGAHELALVEKLDEIRLRRTGVRFESRDRSDDSSVAAAYQEAFQELGLDDVAGRPREAAARIRSSRIRAVLVSALDTWAISVTDDEARRDGLLEAVRLADPDPTGWRDRVRDPASWNDSQALAQLTSTASVAEESVMLLLALAEHVVVAGENAVPFLERIQRQYPGDFWSNFTLGLRLGEAGPEVPPEAALRYIQAAVAVRPDDAFARGLLGLGLLDAGRVEEAVVQLRTVQGEAGIANRCLLIGVLASMGRLDECIVESREILSLDPRCYDALLRLGYALHGSGRFEEARDAYQRAIAIDSRGAVHESLGLVLADEGRKEEAIASLREAVRLEPLRFSARRALVHALIERGRFEEARTEAGLFFESRPTGDPGRPGAKGLLDRCVHLCELEADLPAILDGTRVPRDGAECIAFAELFRGRREHATAARYYADAFDSTAGRLFPVGDRTPVDAMSCAALAGTIGEDTADALGDDERAGWRAMALDWLREELGALGTMLTTGAPRARADVLWCVMRLKSDPALAGVRDTPRLERLPEDERAQWRAVWSDADALLERARAKN